MEIVRHDGGLGIRAFAKVNLFLEVLSQRPDGYHDIDSVFQEIDLADELTIRTDVSNIGVACSDPSIDENENLAARAAVALRRMTGVHKGARIEVRKNIPIGAGLGGGSSDAAAVIAGLNLLWGLNLGTDDLMEIGSGVGSDVPFFFIGGAARVRGRGEVVEPVESGLVPYFVLVCPRVSVSTAKVYKNLGGRPKGDVRDAGAMLAGLGDGRADAVGRAMFNRLQDVTLRLYPALGEVVDALTAERRCRGVLMSGSGSCIYALHESHDAALATYENLKRQGGDRRVYLASAKTIL